MTLERVPASRLRPGDVLYACDRKVEVHDVDANERRVRVALSRSPWFSVPLATHFRRVVRSRRIEMGRKTKRGKK